MAKLKDGKDSEWIQVRLRRKTADKLRAFAARLQRYACDYPNQQPAWLDSAADREIALDLAILTLLWRDDCHAARSRRGRKRGKAGLA